MLKNDEREAVQHALASFLASSTNPQSQITAIFLTEADSILLDIPVGATAPVIAARIMDACLQSRWTHDPSLLQLLLEYLVEKLLKDAFAGLLDRVKRGEDPNPRPYETAWLLDYSRPFFDRSDLRGHMPQFIEGHGRPILLVTADKTSFGRSYTGKFLEHLEDCPSTGVHVAVARVSPGVGPSYKVGDLLAQLRTEFRNSDPLPDRAESSYPLAAAQWLVRQMMSNGGLWLMVLDGFGQRPLNDEVRETVEAVASLVTEGQRRRHVRLVLLDYPHELPNVTKADVLEEELVSAASVGQADLMPCLVAWEHLRRKRGLGGVALAELDKLALGMLSAAPADGKERLETLNAKLTNLLRVP